MQFRIKYRRIVSKEFRDWIIQRFKVEENTPEFRFLHYILLGIPEKEGGLPIPREDLARFKNPGNTKGDRYYKKRIFKAEDFLEEMKERFPELNLTWSDWEPGKRTRVLYFTLPMDVQEKVDHELANLPDENGVLFLEGTKANDRRLKLMERELTEARVRQENKQRREGKIPTQDELLILGYLNNLPPHKFSSILKTNLENAKTSIKGLAPDKQRRELQILESIQLQPKPFYCFSRKSTRLAPYGNSMCTLKSEVRKALTKGWVEVDLKNAQLAVMAMLCDIPELTGFLATGESFWDELFRWFDMKPSPEMKKRFKTAIYCLCFGATKDRIRHGGTSDNGEHEEGLGAYTEHFFQHPIVKKLWAAREALLKQIALDGGMMDAYGNWLQLNEPEYKKGKKIIPKGPIVKRRSILAQVAQSYEQAIIAEIFKLAETTDEFTIMLYQYDGVTLAFRDKRRVQTWLARIKTVVSKKAQAFGIATELVQG